VKTILVDLLFYTGTRGGMETYVRNLYPLMPTEGFRYIALASAELAQSDSSWFPGEVIDSGIRSTSRMGWALGELIAVPRWARKIRADLIHAPANVGPWKSRVPLVLTIQDLLPFRHPEFVAGRYVRLLRSLIRRAAKHASIIITISSASEADIVAYLDVQREEIVVTPLAGPSLVAEQRSTTPRASLLAMGNRLPHKNFEQLIRAIALIPEHERPLLILSGSSSEDPLAPLVAELRLDRWVELKKWIPDDELNLLYATASAVVVPTLFEGFGLPVLESMARGCPVICSDLPVLREVAGDAAVFFDPRDPASIADAIRSTLRDPAELARLSREGIERASGFTWAHTAALTAAAFQRGVE